MPTEKSEALTALRRMVGTMAGMANLHAAWLRLWPPLLCAIIVAALPRRAAKSQAHARGTAAIKQQGDIHAVWDESRARSMVWC